jgi:hypothetical protein
MCTSEHKDAVAMKAQRERDREREGKREVLLILCNQQKLNLPLMS